MGASQSLVTLAAGFGVGYLLGSIPFGLILTRLFGAGDLRSIGSGNIGATNVLRTGHKGLAVATLVLDMLKGTAAVLVFLHHPGQETAIAAALGAFLGHLFPAWLRFRGGKGVATFIGILIGFSWLAALAFAAIWLAVAGISRYSSLAGIAASAATPLVLWLNGQNEVAALFVVLAALVLVMHRANIRRLIAGEELRIGAAKR